MVYNTKFVGRHISHNDHLEIELMDTGSLMITDYIVTNDEVVYSNDVIFLNYFPEDQENIKNLVRKLDEYLDGYSEDVRFYAKQNIGCCMLRSLDIIIKPVDDSYKSILTYQFTNEDNVSNVYEFVVDDGDLDNIKGLCVEFLRRANIK